MKILVCGGREYTDWDFFFKEMVRICAIIGKPAKELTIITGCARGAATRASATGSQSLGHPRTRRTPRSALAR